MVLLCTSCEKPVDIDQPGVCEAHGVQELNQSQGEIGSINEIRDSDIIKYCGDIGWTNRRHIGCVVPRLDIYNEPTGIVDVYYRKSDMCTRTHELCHVKHGDNSAHTARYNRDQRIGHPRPTCPS